MHLTVANSTASSHFGGFIDRRRTAHGVHFRLPVMIGWKFDDPEHAAIVGGATTKGTWQGVLAVAVLLSAGSVKAFQKSVTA